MTDKKTAGLVAFDEIKQSLIAELQAKKQQEKIDEYLKTLMQSAQIEILLEE